MVGARTRRSVVASLLLLALAAPTLAGPIPSRATPDPQRVDRESIQAFVGRDEVARALAAHGFSAEDVDRRIAQLSPEEVAALAANLDQVQAAGEVPQYIWILLAVLMAVTIVTTLL